MMPRGSGKMTIFGTSGNVASANAGIYVQDKWQPIRRLTLNLGVPGLERRRPELC